MVRRLTDFDVVSLDCYGTLIDWETGILAALAPWLERHSLDRTRDQVLAAFAEHETAEESRRPALLYPQVLENVLRKMSADWGVDCAGAEARAFGASVREWPVFPDTTDALRYLQRHYQLVVLSNVDVQSLRTSIAKMDVSFDAVFTAEEIGSYKPDLRNFRHMLESLSLRGVAGSRVLHTAQSMFHDLAPAKQLGLATNWIDRRAGTADWGATPAPRQLIQPDFRHASLEEFVERHRVAAGARAEPQK